MANQNKAALLRRMIEEGVSEDSFKDRYNFYKSCGCCYRDIPQ